MKIAVIGATGRTGRHLIALASARGHDVTAFTRRASALEGVPGVRVIEGDGVNIADLRRAVSGQDAVISIVAAGDLGPTRIASTVTRALIEAMRLESVRRVLVTSSRSIGSTESGLVMAVVWGIFRYSYADLVREETYIEESGLDYTIVRGTRLTDARGTGRYHVDDQPNATGGTASLARADFALAILDAAEDPTTVGKTLGVNGPDRNTPARPLSSSTR